MSSSYPVAMAATLLSHVVLAGFLFASSSRAAGRDEEVSSATGPIRVETLAKLSSPWSMAYLPDGRLLVSEKSGVLRLVSPPNVSSPIEGLPVVEVSRQGGLLGVAVDPSFTRNNYIYFSFVEAARDQPANAEDAGDPRLGERNGVDGATMKGLAVARARLDGQRLSDVQIIWRQKPKAIGRGHFGGQLVFGQDGSLFITSGDRQRFNPAQDANGNLGKIVRINSDGTIPADNPLAENASSSPDILTLGHRNPLGAAFDPATNKLWVHEMGPKGGDEINLIVRGENYGWPLVSDGDHYDGSKIPRHTENKQFRAPAISWNPSISPSGFAFYTGEKFPVWKGKALLGGLSSKSLFVVALDGERAQQVDRIDMGRRIRDVAMAPDGNIVVLGDGDEGALLLLTPGTSRTQ